MTVRFKVGDKVRDKRTKENGVIVEGPIVHGGDWWIRWDHAKDGDREWTAYQTDLEKVNEA